jgi:hypothetical protein
MDRFLRNMLIIVGILSLILAAGFCLQLPWATRLWPWADSSLPYVFLGSITAAAAASLLWIGLSGEFGTLVGGAIHLIVFYAGLALALFLLSQHKGDQRLLIGALLCAAGVLVSMGILLWVRRYPIQDRRSMPLLVRVSFVVFIMVLVSAGIAILLQIPNVFAWKLTPTSSVLIGCFFLGASCYFLYGLLRPGWQNSSGQLWAFLAYDLVLIIPFLLRFTTVNPERLPSLFINTVVLVYSGALAAYYLLVNKATRTWGKSSKAIIAREVAEHG